MPDPSSEHLVDFANSTITALRQAFEVPYAAMVRQDNESGARLYREILRDIETARLCLSPLRTTSPAQRSTLEVKYLARLEQQLTQIQNNSDYLSALRSLPIRGGGRQRVVVGSYTNDATALAALENLVTRIKIHLELLGIDTSQLAINSLRNLIPPQKIAPLQFQVMDHRLSIKSSASKSRGEAERNVETARRELSRNGDLIVVELELSNCDRRLVQRVLYLQTLLAAELDIVRLGFANLTCESVSASLEHELPAAVSAMLRSYTRGIQLLAGQFPEWNEFLEAALATQLNEADIVAVKRSTDHIIESLNAQPAAVDPEVPRTLKMLNSLLSNPRSASKQAAFALLRTTENLISVIFNFGVDLIEKTLTKTAEKASAATSAVMVATLITIALSGAASIGSVASKVPEMAWLKTAADIVTKELSSLRRGDK